jgi:3-carboxy-cis,cis-muconate cycloisomerase
LQPAPPTTFGLKAGGWHAAAQRCWKRADAACRDAVLLQFGGASGTLAALGDQGPAVSEALAKELDLPEAAAPWHAHRDRFAALVSACAIYVGSLGKIARDITLLMQQEVGEAAEAGASSSAMPHKRNPAGCVVALAAATRMPGLASTMLSSLVQEHERASGAWQAEWPVVADAIQITGAACAAMAAVLFGLQVNTERMRANIDATNGSVYSERVMMSLAKEHGRDTAYRMVEDMLKSGRRLEGDPESYLGSAEYFRRRLVAETEE